MINQGNQKLGRSIWTFSLPAVTTCPGASDACKSACYARKGNFLRPNVRDSLLRNYELSKTPNFIGLVAAHLAAHRAKIVRLHPSGDFYSAGYVRRWASIARMCRDTLFYAYTRSWRVPSVRPAVADLARMPNVRVWYSIDRDTGLPKGPPRPVRLAYLAADAADAPPPEADLVFRDGWRTAAKQIRSAGVLVCPVENGTNKPLTCEACRLCFDPEKDPREYKELPPPAAGRVRLL
jgi:hypothetical protein